MSSLNNNIGKNEGAIYMTANDVNQLSLGNIGFFQSHGNFDSFTGAPKSSSSISNNNNIDHHQASRNNSNNNHNKTATSSNSNYYREVPPTIVTNLSSGTFERVVSSNSNNNNHPFMIPTGIVYSSSSSQQQNHQSHPSSMSQSPIPSHIGLPSALIPSPNSSPSGRGSSGMEPIQKYNSGSAAHQVIIPHTTSSNSASGLSGADAAAGGSAYRLHAAKALHKVNSTILRAEQQLLAAIAEGHKNLSAKTNPGGSSENNVFNSNHNNSTFVDVIHGMINDPSCSSTEVARAICNVLGVSQMITSTTPFLVTTSTSSLAPPPPPSRINSTNYNNSNLASKKQQRQQGDSPPPGTTANNNNNSEGNLLELKSETNSQQNVVESNNNNNINDNSSAVWYNSNSNNSSFVASAPGKFRARRATVAGQQEQQHEEEEDGDDDDEKGNHKNNDDDDDVQEIDVDVSPFRPTTASYHSSLNPSFAGQPPISATLSSATPSANFEEAKVTQNHNHQSNHNHHQQHSRRQSTTTTKIVDRKTVLHEESFLRNIEELVAVHDDDQQNNTPSPTENNGNRNNNNKPTFVNNNPDDSNNNNSRSTINGNNTNSNASPIPSNPENNNINNNNKQNNIPLITNSNNNLLLLLDAPNNNNRFVTRESSGNGSMMGRNSSLLLLQQQKQQQEQEENLRRDQFESLIKVLASTIQVLKLSSSSTSGLHNNNNNTSGSNHNQYQYTNVRESNNNINNNKNSSNTPTSYPTSGSGSLSASLAGGGAKNYYNTNINNSPRDNAAPPAPSTMNNRAPSSSATNLFQRQQSAVGLRANQLSFYKNNLIDNNNNNNNHGFTPPSHSIPLNSSSRQPSLAAFQNMLRSNSNNVQFSFPQNNNNSNMSPSSSRQGSMYNTTTNNYHHHSLAAHLLAQHAAMNGPTTSFKMDTSLRSVARGEVMQTKNVVDTIDTVGMRYVNQYMLLESKGRGCQGEVFCALDTNLNEYRAIKVMNRGLFSTATTGNSSSHHNHADFLLNTNSNGTAQTIKNLLEASEISKQIRNEIKILQKCRHPNVVALFEVIDDPSRDDIYLVMQYVEHGVLFRCDPSGRASQTFSVDKFLHYARQLCSGLCYLHEHGIAHRDIKPENILRGSLDVVCLADFGVSDSFSAASNAIAVGLLEHTANTMKSGDYSSAMDNNNNNNHNNAALISSISSGASGSFDPFLGTMTAEERKLLETRIATVYGIGKRCGTTAFLPPEMLSSEISSSSDNNNNNNGAATDLSSLSRQASIAPGVSAVYENPVSFTEAELQAADVWALGLVFYLMLYGSLPFDSSDCWSYIENIVNTPFEIPKMTKPASAFATTAASGESKNNHLHNNNNSYYANDETVMEMTLDTSSYQKHNGQLLLLPPHPHLHVVGDDDDDDDGNNYGGADKKEKENSEKPEVVPRQIRIILSRMLHRDSKSRATISEVRTAFKEVTANLSAKQQQQQKNLQQQQSLTKENTTVIIPGAINNNKIQEPSATSSIPPRVTSNNKISSHQQQQLPASPTEKPATNFRRQASTTNAVTFLSPPGAPALEPLPPSTSSFSAFPTIRESSTSPNNSSNTTSISPHPPPRSVNNHDFEEDQNPSSSNPRHKNYQRKGTMVPSESSSLFAASATSENVLFQQPQLE